MKKLILILFILCSCSNRNTINQNLIVKNFDLNKYLGTWYEIARSDNWFEKNLIDVKAEYSLTKNGKVKVVNSGFNIKNKKYKSINGVAYLINKDLGQLKVSFFRPFYSYYNIVLLDKNYEYVVIIGNNNDYLWILSRNKTMPDELYKEILLKIKNMGFKTENLIKN